MIDSCGFIHISKPGETYPMYTDSMNPREIFWEHEICWKITTRKAKISWFSIDIQTSRFKTLEKI